MTQSKQLREYQLKEKDKTNKKQQSLIGNMGDKNKRPASVLSGFQKKGVGREKYSKKS